MEKALDDRRKKLLYRARYRGFKEADLLIGGFAEEHLAGFDDNALKEFEALLDLNDRQIYEWATGKGEPPANIDGPVLRALMTFRPRPAGS